MEASPKGFLQDLVIGKIEVELFKASFFLV